MDLVNNYIETDNTIDNESNELSNDLTNNTIELDENGLLEICI